jgi:signal transduction histidine kinase
MPLNKAVFGRVMLLLTAVGFAALLGLGAALVWLVDEARGYAAGVAATQEVRVELSQTLSLLQDAEAGQRGYLLTGQEQYLGPYQEAAAALPKVLPLLAEQVIRDGGRPGPVQALQDLAERKLVELRETVALAEAGDREAAINQVRRGEGKAVMDAIRETLAGVESRSTTRLAERSQGLHRSSRALLLGAAGALGLVAIVAVGSAGLAFRYAGDLERARMEVEAANAGLEERVAERTALLQAANEEVQRFAYIVSHDLRAPLVNVMGFTAELEVAVAALEVMLREAETEAPQLVTDAAREAVTADIPEAIGFIRSSTERMDRLISAILRLSREGRRALAPEPVAMGGLIAGIADSLRHQLAEAGAELTIEGSLPDIVTDRTALEQIFANLIDNAVKYLDPARPGRITVTGRAARGLASFAVADNGRGIAPRDHGRIFELFRRSGAQDRPGEGIGLAHVRALARRLGGNVECDSTPGQGSVFRVVLPLAPLPSFGENTA